MTTIKEDIALLRKFAMDLYDGAQYTEALDRIEAALTSSSPVIDLNWEDRFFVEIQDGELISYYNGECFDVMRTDKAPSADRQAALVTALNKDEDFRSRLRQGLRAVQAISPYITGGSELIEAANWFHDMTYPNKRAALSERSQAPEVKVIEGLEEALSCMHEDFDYNEEIIHQAARAYLDLQKKAGG